MFKNYKVKVHETRGLTADADWHLDVIGQHYKSRKDERSLVTVTTLRFDSWSEFVAAAERDSQFYSDQAVRSSRREGRYEFTGTYTFAEARDLAIRGWPDGANRILQMSGDLNRTLNLDVARPHLELALTGGAVDVPTYLTGEHECMWMYHDVGQRRSARVVVDLAVSASVSRSSIELRGAAVLALVDYLESCDIATEVEIRFGTHNSRGVRFVCAITAKRSDEPLDINTLAFSIAHPASLRRMYFGVVEQLPLRVRSAHENTDATFGMPVETLRQELPDPENDILMGGDVKLYRPDEAALWVRNCVRGLGLSAELR